MQLEISIKLGVGFGFVVQGHFGHVPEYVFVVADRGGGYQAAREYYLGGRGIRSAP